LANAIKAGDVEYQLSAALEGLLNGNENEKGNPDGHNHWHNGQDPGRPEEVTTLNTL
jgi:hypothetical protein